MRRGALSPLLPRPPFRAFFRGFARRSRPDGWFAGRRRTAAAGVLFFAAVVGAAGSASPVHPAQPRTVLRVVSERSAAEIPVRRFEGADMVALDELAAAIGATLEPGRSERRMALRLGDRVVGFDAGRSFVSVDSATRVLRNPSRRRSGRWFVPLDFVARVLPDLLSGSRYDRAERVLVVAGEYPALEVEIAPQPNATRVTLFTDPPAPMEIEERSGRLVVRIAAAFLETSFLGAAPRDGVVERVDLHRARDGYRLTIRTGRNFGRFRQHRGPGRFAIDLIRAGTAASSSGGVLTARPQPSAGRQQRRRPARARDIRAIAIDPGHGGADFGAAGATGFAEKDVALAVARALRDRLVEEYGFDVADVVLTRTDDREVPLDDRTMTANAAGADLLISIHLNASPSPDHSGSVVYHHTPGAADRRRDRTVPFLPWNEAQYGHLSASRAFAEEIAAGLASLPVPSRGVAHAPLRVLSGAAMPAVQVELGYVTSPADGRWLADPAFPESAARALATAIVRYRAASIRAAGASR